MKQDDGFEKQAEDLLKKHFGIVCRCSATRDIANALRQVSKESFRKGQLDAEKAIRCEWMDPNGTIWDACEKVQKENKDLLKLILVMVHASGGTIRLKNELMISMGYERKALDRMDEPNGDIVFTVKETNEFLKEAKCGTK